MKKIISTLLILIFVINLAIHEVIASSDAWYFVVTAYYSPLPDQDYYLTGDYESEKRLNGQWIRWASWKAVFSWMLAAPKNYQFGSKIYLEGLWIWEVSDRWGAIVNAWNRWYSYDRIDIWVWYWDEWLRRALYWGKRTVKWNFVDSSNKVTLNYKTIAAPTWATKGLKKISSIFTQWLWIWSNVSLVKKLQEVLTETSLYNWEIDWEYNNEVINIIYDFQVENDLVSNSNSYWAGYWGNKTRSLFLKKYLNWEFDKTEDIQTKEVEIITKVDEVEIVTEEVIEIDLSIFDTQTNDSTSVKRLQEILIELGLYEWELTWVYKDVIDPIYDYQFSKWIVTWIYSPWAWSYWPKTRASLKETYKEYIVETESIKKEEAAKVEEERLEQLKIEEEKTKADARQKELEEKYKSIEELSLKKAEEKLSFIWTPIFWEVSHSVRELQISLKQLWFFTAKDTAIYWPVTKESIIAFQKAKKLINVDTDPGAGHIWPKTKEALKFDLKEKFMQEMISKEEITQEEIASIDSGKI